MHCPRCNVDLKQSSTKEGSRGFHYCPNCKGKAVQQRTLKHEIDINAVNELFNLSPNGNSSFACPSCNSNMHESAFERGDTSLQLDVCPDCGLVWFDFSEHYVFKSSNPPRAKTARSSSEQKAVKSARPRNTSEEQETLAEIIEKLFNSALDDADDVDDFDI